MIQHIIAIASSYKQGRQIAWHYAAEKIDGRILEELSVQTKSLPGRPNYSIHKLSTDSAAWQSVLEKDSYFEGYTVYPELKDFLIAISEDKKVTALDVAKLLLSIQPMSNRKLQKMLYLVYADYLTTTKKRLFDEKILAYKYGPVIKDVYTAYQSFGRDKIEDDSQVIILNEIPVPAAVAKILQAGDYQAILSSVAFVFAKFGSKTAVSGS